VRALLRFAALETTVPVAVALTEVAFACGSSSVPWLSRVGRDARWAFLFVLVASAAGLFAVRVAWSRARPFALAGWLVALATVSVSWSVAPGLTVERAASVAVLFAAGFFIATAAASLALIERVLVAVLAGAVIVALLGLLILAVDRGAALQTEAGLPTRFRGLGEDANTAALLFGVVLPIAAWGITRGGRRGRRFAAAAAFMLLDGSMVAALSRGALVGGFIGVVVVALAAPRTTAARLSYAAAAVLLAVASYGVTRIPSASAEGYRGVAAVTPRYVDVDHVFPLDEDIGSPLPNGRATAPSTETFTWSGRLRAWDGALGQVSLRPATGYGFGTEQRVFVDRYRGFGSGFPENSYIGFLLQLGAAGLASFLALAVLWLVRGARAYGRLGERDRLALVAAAGVVVAGLACAFVQSYLTSVGNIATAAFWIGAFLLAALGDPRSVWPFRPPID
jgi:O-Antigen ligase